GRPSHRAGTIGDGSVKLDRPLRRTNRQTPRVYDAKILCCIPRRGQQRDVARRVDVAAGESVSTRYAVAKELNGRSGDVDRCASSVDRTTGNRESAGGLKVDACTRVNPDFLAVEPVSGLGRNCEPAAVYKADRTWRGSRACRVERAQGH